MPWVRFVSVFPWHPRAAVTIAYKAGTVQLVTTRCAEAAQRKGAAVTTQRPETSDGDDAHR